MKTIKSSGLYFAVICFGFASMATQILLLRELMVVFYGNELSVGIMLASWLFWISIGSLVSNSISRYLEHRFKSQELPDSLFHLFLISTSIAAPLSIYLIRNIKNILGASAGEIIGLAPMASSSFILLAPVCLIFGSLFALSCRLAARHHKETGIEAGKVYLLESVGAVIGGLAFNFLFVRSFNPLQTTLFCGVLNIFAVLIMTYNKRASLRWAATLSFMALVIFSIYYGAKAADLRMRQFQWNNFKLITVRDSYYGNIVLTKLESQLNMFENGLLVASTNDPLTAEESVQYAMLEHPDPKRVLLIGGSLTGALDEVLKHPVESVDCVELDPDMIKIGRDSYPKPLIAAFGDPRTHLHYSDGRLFVKNLASKDGAKYDVVILTLPNPFTAQINRFYSLEFCGEVKKVLNEGGVFSFGVTSSENYVSPEQAQFLACLYKTLKEEFKEVKILPGDNNFFLASGREGLLTYDYKVLLGRIKERGLRLNYVNEYYLPNKFDPERISYLEGAVKTAMPGAKINRDFRPIGYLYDMVLWSSRFNSGAKEIFKKLYNLKPAHIAIFLSAAFAALFILKIRTKKAINMGIALSIGSTGFSTMLLQIAIIIAFQVIYGYVYYKIGLIFASFMLGLAAGSLLAIKIINNRPDLMKIYRNAQLSLGVYSLALPLLFANPLAFEITFLALPLAAGTIGGLQFPLANKICEGKDSAKTAGFLYGVDLLGACAGALITSAILIPVIGINSACYLTGLLNLLVYLLLFSNKRS